MNKTHFQNLQILILAILVLFVTIGCERVPEKNDRISEQSNRYGLENCTADRFGEPYCPPPNGQIAKNKFGDLVCGLGQCMKDRYGDYQCSTQNGGFAVMNKLGTVVCTGGCDRARKDLCQKPIN